MSQLFAEIGLRLAKALAATAIGLIVYGLATSLFGATPSVELGLLAWLTGAALILIVESSPI